MPPIENTETETTLREDIEAAITEHAEPAPEPEATPEPAPEAEAADAPEAEGDETAEGDEAADGRVRDEKGRFVSKKADAPAGAADAEAGEPPAEVPVPTAAPAGPPSPAERPPQSWKPLAREHWATLPTEVRQEVLRREQETQRVLQESAQARKSHSEFQEAIRPYEAMIRAEAGDPVRAVSGLLQTAFQLRTAPPLQKAQIVATLMQGYGVPVEALDAVLSGQAQAYQAPPGPVADPRVDQLFQKLEQAEQARRATATQSAQAMMEEFAGQHEFFEDVREDMGVLMEVAARQGQKLTLKTAYDRALTLREDLQKIIKQREAAKSAVSAKAQAQRAKAASSSVKSAPTVTPSRSSDDTTLREDIELTIKELSGRAR
jgi:hypothetical protein